MPRHNAAARLHRVLTKVLQTPADAVESADLWAKVFGIPEDFDPDSRVIATLGVLRAQLGRIRFALKTQGVAEETWQAAVTGVDRALSPRQLGSKWATVTQHLTPETMSVLALLAEILPNESVVLAEATITEIELHLSDLLHRTETSDLPLELKLFLVHQIATARDALSDYPLRGPAAFTEASDASAQEWAVNQDLVREHMSDPLVRETFDIWPSIKEKAKNVLLLGQLAKLLFIDAPQIIAQLPAPDFGQEHFPSPAAAPKALPSRGTPSIEDE